MFLAQAMSADWLCQQVVKMRGGQTYSGWFIAMQHERKWYYQARQRLPLDRVSSLARYTGELMTKPIPTDWRWHEKRVHLIDGTRISLPDTAANQAVYPQQSGRKPGLGFPICRVSN